MAEHTNTRALSLSFFNAFKNGELTTLLETVKNDPSLIMCFRGESTMVYYRGLLMLTIKQSPVKKSISFKEVDNDYYKEYKITNHPSLDCDWMEYFKEAKHKIDMHCINKPCLEKEIQQIMFRENSCNSIADETDYFIFDVEYAHNDARFDALAMYWAKDDRSKYLAKNLKFAIIELKAGNGAIKGKAGLSKHFKDVKKFINQTVDDNFLEDMATVFAQMLDLKLINTKAKPERLALDENAKPSKFKLKKNDIQFIFALANFNCNSEILKDIKFDIKDVPFKTYFAKSPFLGYGLYEKCLVSVK